MNKVLLESIYTPDPLKGIPLSFAKIYVGLPDTDPEVLLNQKQISIQQEDGTIVPVAQPITTSAGGIAVYLGNPVIILVEGNYSLKILDSTGAQIYYVPNSNPLSGSVIAPLLLADLKALSPTLDGQQISTSGRIAQGDKGGGRWVWDSGDRSSEVVGDPQEGIHVAPAVDPTGASGAWVREYTGNIHSEWFGGIIGGSDVGAELTAAALYANSVPEVLELPAGELGSSVSLDWSTYTALEVIGAGHFKTNITFTTDVDGIVFGGRRIEGLSVTGIGAAATKDGIIYTTTNRKFAQRLQATKFFNGHRYDQGNLSYFNFIFGVSNNNDGFQCSGLTIDANATTFGQMDLRGNGGIGFNQIGTPVNASQQLYGGLIVCQSNGGAAMSINSRGCNLTLYDEANGQGLVLGATSEGNQVIILFGGVSTDSGTNNNVILARVGAVEAWINSNLQYSSSELNNRPLIGFLTSTQTADRAFQYQITGTSASGVLNFNHSTATSACNVQVQGRIHGQVIQNIDLATFIGISEGSVLELTNSAPTSILFASSANGHTVTIIFMDNNSTIRANSNQKLVGGVDFIGTTNDTLTIVFNNLKWYEVSRSVNA